MSNYAPERIYSLAENYTGITQAILMPFVACLALLSMPAIAAGQDHIYVYKQGVNLSYSCAVVHFYVETENRGSLFADQCQLVTEDNQTWPYFDPIGIWISLRGKRVNVEGECMFVATARRNGTTSTVIDCRT